jgi:hypothetical protein
MATTLALVLAVSGSKASAPRTPGLNEARPAVVDPSSNPVAHRLMESTPGELWYTMFS